MHCPWDKSLPIWFPTCSLKWTNCLFRENKELFLRLKKQSCPGKAVNVNAYQRRSKNVFDTAWTVFAACGVSDANWSRCIYIQKGSAFFKYYLKILIRMAITPHTREKTEPRHGRPNLLQSVINRLNSWGSAIIFRLDVEEKANLRCGARRGDCFHRHDFSFFFHF